MITIQCNCHVASFTRKSATLGEFAVSKAALGLPTGVYAFEYRYPLTNAARFMHALGSATSVLDILESARGDYEAIYKAEFEASAVPVGRVPGMLNRNKTEGPYGIWGHGISDLYFETVVVDPDKRVVTFAMGS